MPKQIIIVRHGETAYNAQRRMQGWLDIPLNEQGHAQAKETATKLAHFHLDAIYSSDLRRAHETAQHIAPHHKLEITITSALRERDMGIFAGWAWETEPDPVKEKLWPEFTLARDTVDLDWNKHKGESLRQMTSRVHIFMQELHAKHPDQKVALVTHGGTINRLLEHLDIKKPSDGFRSFHNASILVLNRQYQTYSLEEM